MKGKFLFLVVLLAMAMTACSAVSGGSSEPTVPPAAATATAIIEAAQNEQLVRNAAATATAMVVGTPTPTLPPTEMASPTQPPAATPTATPATSPTAMATETPATGETATATTSETSCPTEREFFELTGIRADIDPSEPCMFHWRGDPNTIVSENACPSGWICTTGVAENPWQTYVVIGEDGISQEIFSITARLVVMYPDGDAVHTPCTFLKKVQEEGRVSDPQWTAKPWNFTCP